MIKKKLSILFKITPYIILFIFTLITFFYSISLRKQWFGILTLGDHHFLTGSTILFTKNWVNEKPRNLYYGMLENPKSVEFNNLKERGPYVSYPPGAIIPIYLISLILKKYPNTAMVMNYNLFNHFLISFILGLITYILFRQYKINKLISLFFAFIPIILEIFLPGPFYFLQNIYFSDQAVLLPFVLTILCEIILDENKKNSLIKIIQSLIILFGVFTDWYFYFLIFAILIKRIFIDKDEVIFFQRLIKNIYILILSLFPILFLAWQTFKFRALNLLLERFLVRTGVSFTEDNTKNFLTTFWWSHFKINFGEIGVFLYWLSFFLIFLTSLILLKLDNKIIRKNNRFIYYLINFLILPLVHTYIFKNHSIVHDFSTLKFSITIALIPYALFPLLWINLLNQIENKQLFLKIINFILLITTFISVTFWILSIKYFNGKEIILIQKSFFFSIGLIQSLIIFLIIKNKKISIFFIWFISLLMSISYLKTTFPLIHKQFKDKQEIPVEKIGKSIYKCSEYNDVIFSFELAIPDKPPVLLSQSMKRVYLISSLKEIQNKVKNIKQPFIIKLVFLNKPSFKKYKFIKSLETYQCLGLYYSSFNQKQLQTILKNDSY